MYFKIKLDIRQRDTENEMMKKQQNFSGRISLNYS